MIKITLIVPFYNEASVLKRTSLELVDFCQRNFPSSEIIFVDDGSTDQSANIINSLIKKYPRTRLLSNPINMGRGEAVRNGIKNAKGLLVGYLDADLEIKPSYLIQAFKLLERNDVVIASKFLSDSQVRTTVIRKISSIIFNFLVRLILKSSLHDHQTGLKVMKSQVAKKILPMTHEKGWFWDIEFLILAQRLGYYIQEIPINVTYGYRSFRTSFIINFLKLPVVLWRLKQKINSNVNFLNNEKTT
jgi:glycosyltransferase AglD